MAKRGDLLVGLDIGTTKVCAIIGEVTENGIDIIGIGTQPSKGLRKGVVINIDSTVNSIKRAVEEAELLGQELVDPLVSGVAFVEEVDHDHVVLLPVAVAAANALLEQVGVQR